MVKTVLVRSYFTIMYRMRRSYAKVIKGVRLGSMKRMERSIHDVQRTNSTKIESPIIHERRCKNGTSIN